MVPILIILALLVIVLISINIKILGVIQDLLENLNDQAPRIQNIEREQHSIFLDIMEVLEKLEDLKFK